jgi:hypothetical protein
MQGVLKMSEKKNEWETEKGGIKRAAIGFTQSYGGMGAPWPAGVRTPVPHHPGKSLQ